jgi:hypothetical protein
MKYRYVVTPWKIHFTDVPGYKTTNVDLKSLLSQTHRDYKYLYSGQNSDILSFNLQYNYLYYESIPPAGGTNNLISAQGAAGKESQAEESLRGEPILGTFQLNPYPQKLFDPSTQTQQPIGGSGGQLQESPV